ncbi:MAG: NAD(P)/FAD-dependent oxidoreductase, partial [Actinomycetota bacterium]|nr:NAD(P)/FAD-dependent oxidoreductase [Actinomycetota bacterium]
SQSQSLPPLPSQPPARSHHRLIVRTGDGAGYEADAVILASGDDASLAQVCGLRRCKQRPVLCGLRCERGPLRGLEGLRAQVGVTLLRAGKPLARERGEVIFKKEGVSGIPILNLSRVAEPDDELSLDLMPDRSEDGLAMLLRHRVEQLSWRAPGDFLIGMMHRRWSDAVRRQAKGMHAGPAGTGGTRACETPDATCLGGTSPEALARVMKDYRLVVSGIADPRAAQVTRGGICNDGFDPDTLESKHMPGLYASGEVLDVDGRCGGYNLHWAWASGLVAGTHAAQPPSGT